MAVLNLNIIEMLKTKMQYDGERQKVLSENIANQSIPGYRAKDVVPLNFSNVLASEVKKVDIKITDKMHLSGAKPHTQRFLNHINNDPFEVKPTGNTVSNEEQLTKVAQNAADYQMSANLYKKIGNLFKEALGLQPS